MGMFEHHLCLPCYYVPITLLITLWGRGSWEESRHAALFTNQIYVLCKRDTSLAMDTSDHTENKLRHPYTGEINLIFGDLNKSSLKCHLILLPVNWSIISSRYSIATQQPGVRQFCGPASFIYGSPLRSDSALVWSQLLATSHTLPGRQCSAISSAL